VTTSIRDLKPKASKRDSFIWDPLIRTHTKFVEYLKERNLDKLDEYLKVMFAKPLTLWSCTGDYYYNRLKKNEDEIQKNTAFGSTTSLCLC
jgi:hypothetical protein